MKHEPDDNIDIEYTVLQHADHIHMIKQENIVKQEPCEAEASIYGAAATVTSNIKEEPSEEEANLKARGRNTCNVCDKSFSCGYLKEHQLIHTGEKPFKCRTCDKIFRTASQLKQHQTVHTREKPYICHICDKRFKNSSQLHQHKLIHDDDIALFCDACNKSYKSSGRGFKLHEQKHKENPFMCKICKNLFPTLDALTTHEAVHPKPYVCHLCNKKYKLRIKLEGHLKTHIVGKACEVCKETFGSQKLLWLHQLNSHQ